jgi:hypothetical protein
LTELWQTGQYQVGTYVLRGLLYNPDGELIHESTSAFELSHAINGEPLATLRTTTDKPVYNTNDVAQLFNLAQNLATNQTIDDASLQITVIDPTSTVVFTETVTVGSLASGALRDFTSLYSFAQAAEGTYTVTSELLNSTGESLATDQTQFEVQANLQQLLVGEVQAQVPTLDRGQLQSCTDTVINNGTHDLIAQPLRQLVVNVTDGQAVTTTDLNVDLASNTTQVLQRDVATNGLDAGLHACIIQAQINGEWVSLANDTFTVTLPPIDIDSDLLSGDYGRLLVLLDGGSHQDHESNCDDDKHNNKEKDSKYDDDDHDDDKHKNKNTRNYSKYNNDDHDDHDDDHDDDDDEHASDCDDDHDDDHHHNKDPHGSSNAPDLVQQQAYLETLLTEHQWSYTIVTDVDAFTREFRTGTYTVYALFAEQAKLAEQVQQELREAVFRGDGLFVAGGHDHRHNKLDTTLGLKFKGKHSKVDGVDIALSSFPLSGISQWSFDEKPLKVTGEGAEEIGYYLDSNQAIAVSRHGFGEGRSVFAGFDLLAQASQAEADPFFGELILAGLLDIEPDTADMFAGAPAAVQLNLTNLGIATPGQAIITVPENTTILDTGAAQLEANNSLLWSFDLAEDASDSLTFWLQLPPLVGSIDITSLIQVGTAPDLSDFTLLDLALSIDTAPTLLDVLVFPEIQEKTYKKIRKDIEKAQNALDKGDAAKALKYAIKATNRFDKLSGQNADAIRLQLDNAIRVIARQL